jgi:hypothetical protein
MYMFINSLILALLVPIGQTDRAQDGPACHAELAGLDLRTVIEFPTGLKVEGPWRVVHSGELREGEAHYKMFATLDRVVETDGMTGNRNVIPFPEPISLAFEGSTQKDLIHHAAQVWCVTVMRAQENQQLQRLSPDRATQTRVAAAMVEDRRS